MTDPDHPGRRRAVGAWLVMAGLGGVAGLGFEPTAWWPCYVAGLAGFFWRIVRARSARQAAGWGYAFGFGMNLVALNWLASLLPGAGPAIALLLVAFMSLYVAVIGVAARWAARWDERAPGVGVLGVALVWTAGEWLYARFPFGGFGWTRGAYAMVDSPLAGWLPLVSVPGVSFLTAVLAALIARLASRLSRERARRTTDRRWLRPAGAAVLALGALAIGVLLGGGALARAYQVEPAQTAETVTVGMVQGNVDGVGVGGMGRARSVTNNHYAETVTLMARARSGAVPMPDFVLWPENSTDIDPLKDAATHQLVQSASDVAAVPVFVGAVTSGPGPDERQTTALWWMPDGSVAGTYHKRNLVPFGEYIPFRDQLLPVIPLLELVGAQSIPGTSAGVLDVPLTDGRRISVGDVICFELAYDQTVREAMRGSQVMVVQSNNATYRGTPQIDQQFQITRARAMEARREIVVATTNSVSGYIDRDGRVIDRTREMRAASGSYTVPLRTATTPATRYGRGIEATLAALGLLAALTGAFWPRRSARAGRMKA